MGDSNTFSSTKKDPAFKKEASSSQSIPLDRGTLPFILAVINPFKGWVFVIFFVGFAWSIDATIQHLILKWMIDKLPHISRENAFEELWPYGAAYAGISFLMTFLFRWFDYAWLVLNPALKRELGLILTKRMMAHSVSLTHNHFSGNLANKIKDTMSGVPDLVRLIGYRFFSHIMTVLIAIGIFWSIHPKIALAFLTWSIGFILFSLTIGKKDENSAIKQPKCDQQLSDKLLIF